MAEEEFSNELVIFDEGRQEKINVLDIIESLAYGKTFIIYTAESRPNTVYASILNEQETTYSLDTITNPEEIAYINNEIARVIDEIKMESTM